MLKYHADNWTRYNEFRPGGNLWFRKMKPMWKCLKPAFLPLTLCKNKSVCMVSIASFTSSAAQQDVHFVNYGHIYFKIDDKEAYAFGRIDKLLPAVMYCSAVWLMDVKTLQGVGFQ